MWNRQKISLVIASLFMGTMAGITVVQTTPSAVASEIVRQEERQVELILPRDATGAVDATAVRNAVNGQLSQGVAEIQFRDVVQGDVEGGFLNVAPNQNLLGAARGQLANCATGVECTVRFRGVDVIDARVQRQEDGTLRARMVDINLDNSTLSAEARNRLLTPGGREQLARDLSTQFEFDRVRIRGRDAAGNRVRLEFRSDKGVVRNESRGITQPAVQSASGSGSGRSGSSNALSGSGRSGSSNALSGSGRSGGSSHRSGIVDGFGRPVGNMSSSGFRMDRSGSNSGSSFGGGSSGSSRGSSGGGSGGGSGGSSGGSSGRH